MASPFLFWSSLGPFYETSAGDVNGEDWAISNPADGGTPIWATDYTPTSSYVSGSPGNYTIVMTTQDFLGDIQPLVTVTTDNDIVDPFGSGPTAIGNLVAPVIFSSNATTGTGGLVYWTSSTTPGDYAVDFEPLTVSYPAAPASSPLATLTGPAVTMISAVANPISWSVATDTATSMVFAYVTEASSASTTESLYFQGFNNDGVATGGAVLIASGLPKNDPYYIGYNSSGYGYRYLEIGGTLGTGLVLGTFNPDLGTRGTPSLYLSLPSYSSFDGISSFSLSDGNSLRLIEGVSNGQPVLQSFLNKSSTPQATFDLTEADDHFGATDVYDPNTGALDYIALAYTDAGHVHLELLDDNGVQIGGDLVIPGISSFDRIHTLTGSVESHSTRVEIDYTVADPNGGYQIEGFIYDTATSGQTYPALGPGEHVGTPFNDTFDWGTGVYYLDGGGGSDTLVATSLSTAQVTLSIDAAGETILNDGAGDIDTLRRFTTIDLADATVTISGNTLTQANSDGSTLVSTFNITGQSFTSRAILTGANGFIEYKYFYDVTGEGNLTAFKYLYAGNNVVGTDEYYTGVTGQVYTNEEVDYNGAGQLIRAAYSGLTGSPPYSSFEYDYVGGVFAGSKFTYTTVPQGATYTSYEVDYDENGAVVAEKFYNPAVSGQNFTSEEVDYTFSGGQSQLAKVILGNITNQPYYQLEEDYVGGVYSSYKAYYHATAGQSYLNEVVDVTSQGVLQSVVYNGVTNASYQSVEEDYSNGALTQTTYGVTNIIGAGYNAEQYTLNAAGTGYLSIVYDLNSGGHTQEAYAAGQTLTSEGNDTFINNSGGSATFVLNPIYGHDTIYAMSAADSVLMSNEDFQGFQDMLNHSTSPSANEVVATANNGDTLTFKNTSLATLEMLSNNFHFS